MYKRQGLNYVRAVVEAHGGSVAVTSVLHEGSSFIVRLPPVSYTHLRAHETVLDLVCRLLLEKKKKYRTNTH